MTVGDFRVKELLRLVMVAGLLLLVVSGAGRETWSADCCNRAQKAQRFMCRYCQDF